MHATMDNPEYRAGIRNRVLRRRLEKAQRDIRARRVRDQAQAFRKEAEAINAEDRREHIARAENAAAGEQDPVVAEMFRLSIKRAVGLSDRVDILEYATRRLLHWMDERGIPREVIAEALILAPSPETCP